GGVGPGKAARLGSPMESVEIVKPGLLTTVQDLGRAPYLPFGVAVSGAVDPLALRLGNLLVGNEEGDAGLEITLVGPEMVFRDRRVIAVTGGDLSPRLNGRPIPLWKAVT